MSVASTLEYIDMERSSFQPDEWLDYLIHVRDAVEARIERAKSVSGRQYVSLMGGEMWIDPPAPSKEPGR